MNGDQAHEIACRAFSNDPRIKNLLARYGDDLYSSLLSPSAESQGRWIEYVLLGRGVATYIDDPRGTSEVVARCEVDPVSGAFEVIVETCV